MRKLIIPATLAMLGIALVVSGVTFAARDTGGIAGPGGSFLVELNVQDDQCDHDPFIFGSASHNMKLTVIKDGSFVSIQGPAPWVNVNGSQDGGHILASGQGQVGPNSQALVQFEGSLEGQFLIGKYTMGAGPADLPPCGPQGALVHHPAVYEVKPKPTTPTPTVTATPTHGEKQFSIIVLKLNNANNQPIAGVKFNLFAGPNCQGTSLLSRTTGQRGLLDFTGLAPGLYSVREKEQAGWNVVGEICQNVQLPQGSVSGNVPTCLIVPNADFPQPGCDEFNSGARVIVRINGTDVEFPVTLNGPTQIERINKPHKVNGFDRVDTEMVFMELVGASPVGDIVVRESDSRESLGAITEQQNTGPNKMNFPANSFFDVFFEVDIAINGQVVTLHNADAFRVACKIEEIPPILCFYQPPVTDPIDLLNADGVKVAKIVHALHIPLPPKEVLVVFTNNPKGTATPTPTRTPTPTNTPTPGGNTVTPTARPTNPPPNGLCQKTGQNVPFQGAVWHALWKCRPDPLTFRFDRIDIFVGTATQDPHKLDIEHPPLFQCQSTSQVVTGMFKGYKKNVNPGTALPHHEVWSANFDGKCDEGVNVYLQTTNPDNHAVIQAVAFTNSTGPQATPTPTRPPGGGDVNKDGNVNSIDSALVLQAGAGLTTLQHPGNADTNRDGSVNAVDATLILQKVAGLIPSLPV